MKKSTKGLVTKEPNLGSLKSGRVFILTSTCICLWKMLILTEGYEVCADLLFVCTTMHCSLKAYCAILVRHSNFHYQESPRVTKREHPATEGETVRKKCPVILLK
jgi:hypothetical protein